MCDSVELASHHVPSASTELSHGEKHELLAASALT